jgi:cation diffusion facilitator CzcD-associated flavoprotein CzcO
MSTTTEAVEEVDVLVIGAGFAGIYQLDRLRNLGHSVKVWEAGPELGGIWYWNCYPGARVDTEGPIYQLSYKDLWKDWEYTELYPDWTEVREYFAYLDRKLDISKDVRFNTRVTAAHFHDDHNQWVVRASDGTTVRCTYLVPCLGFASKPYIPQIPGLAQDDFEGRWHHTGLWPQEGVNFTGKRVAVIGTGASGVQVVQEAARDAAQLTLFQRTPNLAIPMGQRKLGPADQAAIKEELPERFETRGNTFAGFDFDFISTNAVDLTAEERTAGYERLWQAGGFRFWLAVYQDTLFDPKSNDHAYAFWRDKTRARIKDPAMWEKLAPTTPPHPFGVKRPSLEQNYYEAFNQDNVALVDLNDTPIQSLTEHGVLTADGVEREFDVIVLATGFDAVSGGYRHPRRRRRPAARQVGLRGAYPPRRGHRGVSEPAVRLRPAEPLGLLQRPDLRRDPRRDDRRDPRPYAQQRPPAHRSDTGGRAGVDPPRGRPGRADAVPPRQVLVRGREHPRQAGADAQLPGRASAVPREVRGVEGEQLRRIPNVMSRGGPGRPSTAVPDQHPRTRQTPPPYPTPDPENQ